MYFKCIVYCFKSVGIYKHKLSRIEFFIRDLIVFEAIIKLYIIISTCYMSKSDL